MSPATIINPIAGQRILARKSRGQKPERFMAFSPVPLEQTQGFAVWEGAFPWLGKEASDAGRQSQPNQHMFSASRTQPFASLPFPGTVSIAALAPGMPGTLQDFRWSLSDQLSHNGMAVYAVQLRWPRICTPFALAESFFTPMEAFGRIPPCGLENICPSIYVWHSPSHVSHHAALLALRQLR